MIDKSTGTIPYVLPNRCTFADTLKYVLIFLVVYGHFLEAYYGDPNKWMALHGVIYSFHMPLFIFISGYFSKHVSRQRRKEIDLLLYPFVVYQILNIICLEFPCFPPQSKNPFVPLHQNWYILSLFFWRTFMPYCSSFKKPVVIVVTLLLAFAAGFNGYATGSNCYDYFLAFHRTVYWFPVFLFGYYCEDIMMLVRYLQKYKYVFMSLFVLLITVVYVLSLSETTYLYVLQGFTPGEGHHGDWLLLITRVIAYVVSAVVSLGFMCILSLLCDKWKWINNVSKALGGTMLLYLVHFSFIYPVNDVIVEPFGRWAPILMFGVSLCLFVVFTNKAVVKFFAFTTDLSVVVRMITSVRKRIETRKR